MALTKVTGQVIKNTTDVTVGVLTVTNTLAVGGTVSIGGTLTYEDVTNVDAVGLITARNGIVVGSGITLSKDGDIFATGISTFSEGIAGDLLIDDKIVHRGDTDTAIRFPTDNTFSVETAGTQRLLINQNGRYLINTNPTGTAKQARLGPNNFNPLFQVETQDNTACLQVTRIQDDANPARLSLQTGRGTSASPSIAQDGDQTGQILFSAYDGDTFTNTAQIRSEIDGTPGDDDMPGNLIFGTTSDGSPTASERLRITSAGEVRIANGGFLTIDTSPASTYGVSEALRIDDGGNYGDRALQIFEYQHSGTRYHRIQFNTNTSTNGSAYTYTQGAYGGSSSIMFDHDGQLRFFTDAQVTDGSTDAITPSERFRINSNGRILINSTTSRSIGGSVTRLVQVEGTAGESGISIARNSNNASPSTLNLAKSRSGSVGGNTIVQDGDMLGSINFAGADGTDLQTSAAQIIGAVDGTPGSNDMPGRLMFYTTADGASTTSERMRITSAGKLLVNHTTGRGVGNANIRLLQVEGVGGESAITVVRNSNNTSGAGLMLGKSRSNSVGGNTIVNDGDKLGVISFCGADGVDLLPVGAQITGEVDGTPGADDMPGRLVFKTTADGATSTTERFKISSSGAITATLGSANDDNFNIQGHASQGRTILKLIAGNDSSNSSTSVRLVRSNGNAVFSLSLTHDENHGNIVNAVTGGFIKFHVNESGSSLVRHVMTDTGHFVNCRGSSGRIAFGTNTGVLYSGIGRYDGAAQDVGLSLYATTNAGTSFVEHFRMTHNGTLQATDTSIGSLSDSRLKKNIADYSYDISKFKQFKPKTFDWINPEVHGDKTSVKGFTAQDIELIDSDWVEETFVSKDDPDFSLVSETTTTNGAGETVGVSKASKFGYKDAMYISVIQQLISRIETLEDAN